MTLRKHYEVLQNERGKAKSNSLRNSILKRLLNCRKIDCVMMMMMMMMMMMGKARKKERKDGTFKRYEKYLRGV